MYWSEQWYNCDSLYKSAGILTLSQTSHVSEEADNVGLHEPPVIARNACSRNNEQGRVFAVQREPTVRGVETSSPGGSDDMAAIWSSCRRSLCIARKCAMSPVLLSRGRRCTDGCGCSSPRMARRATVCVPPVKPNRADITEGKRSRSNDDSNSTILAGDTVGSGDHTAALRPAMAITSTQGSSLPSMGGDIPPLPGEAEFKCSWFTS